MKNILITLALLISFSSLSQSDLKSTFDRDLNNFYDFTNNKEYDKLLDLMNPKLFQLASREQMIQTFESLESMGMNVITGLAVITNISEIINFEEYKYCRVYYEGDMTMQISGQLLSGIDNMKEFVNAEWSPKSVSVEFDESTNTFYIKRLQQSMIAAAKAKSNDWRYIEFKNMQLLQQIIPLEVIEKLK